MKLPEEEVMSNRLLLERKPCLLMLFWLFHLQSLALTLSLSYFTQNSRFTLRIFSLSLPFHQQQTVWQWWKARRGSVHSGGRRKRRENQQGFYTLFMILFFVLREGVVY
jgi:hypothetical protein